MGAENLGLLQEQQEVIHGALEEAGETMVAQQAAQTVRNTDWTH